VEEDAYREAFEVVAATLDQHIEIGVLFLKIRGAGVKVIASDGAMKVTNGPAALRQLADDWEREGGESGHDDEDQGSS
jgi:hypothetical protein